MMNFLDKQKVTLYCLPFAGGHALSYRDFQAHVAEEIISVKSLDLPGHGKRMKEPLLADIETMANDIFHQIQNHLDGKPYAIYGHSMGALLGYVLTKQILHADLPAPMHLFLSSRRAPSVPNDKPPKHNLPHDEFIKTIKELGGLPNEVLAEPVLMELIIPILRTDFKAAETYVYNPTSPFDIPMTIMRGLTEETTYAQIREWQRETTLPVSIRQFTGDHFFIFEHLPKLGQIFSNTLFQAVQNK